jgi:hypothetical protein
MWKIQRLEDPIFVVLGLSGRLEGCELVDLQKVLTSVAGGQGIVLDLKDVKLVDQQAVDFLAQCEEEGIQLRSCPPYIRAWITQEKNRI